MSPNGATFPRRAATAIAAVAAFFAFASFAYGAGVAIVSGPSVSDTEITSTSAVVRWQTDVESTTVVRFGTTAALGQEYKKIVPIEETEITEVVHTMTLAGLAPDTTYFYVARSATPDGSASVDSPMLSFHTRAACQADVWQCSAFGACDAATGTQSRTCTMTSDCPDVVTPKPAESQACTPACTADTWTCTAFGACDAATRTQTRTCTLKTDCPAATTAKPPESRSCTPACTEDAYECRWGTCRKYEGEGWLMKQECRMTSDCPGVETAAPTGAKPCCVEAPDGDAWTCSDWGTCEDGVRRRECRMTSDCPEIKVDSPPTAEPCEAAATDLGAGTDSSASVNGPVAAASSGEGVSVNGSLDASGVSSTVSLANGTGTDANSSAPPEYVVHLVGADFDTQQQLVFECRARGILADRCAAWLESKYQDRRCLDAGKTTRGSCESYLTGLNGGTFPGCEGRTDSECAAAKARALLGYLPEDGKRAFDTALDAALAGGGPVESVRGLTAVTPAAARDAIWWPSLRGEGQETAPAMVIRDSDKDGLPDDLEARMGWDPRRPDVEDGLGKGRGLLKSFFQTGDKPVQFVFVDADGNGSIDLVEDRDLLGLKHYDPVRVYLPGDASRRAKNMFASLFGEGGTELVGVDLDGDGVPDGKVSREVLKSFFQTGDKPTEAQFRATIDPGKFAAADLALMTDHAIGQPTGAGETDPSFTVQVAPYAAGGDHAALQRLSQDANEPALGTPTGRDQNEPDAIGAEPPKPEGPLCKFDGDCPYDYPQCINGRCIKDGRDANDIGDDMRGAAPRDAGPSGFTLRGKAAPNSVVVLYVYSYVPMVLTTTTDENGEYTYDVSGGVMDGEHTAYVAITDETGKVAKKSGPLSFFVKEAKAVTEEDFQSADVNVPLEPVARWQRSYLIGAGVAVLAALVGAWLLVARRLSGVDEPPPTEPPAPPAS